MKKILKAHDCDNPYPPLYTAILEWLYTNQDGYDSRGQWRNAFIKFLREEFNVEEYDN